MIFGIFLKKQNPKTNLKLKLLRKFQKKELYFTDQTSFFTISEWKYYPSIELFVRHQIFRKVSLVNTMKITLFTWQSKKTSLTLGEHIQKEKLIISQSQDDLEKTEQYRLWEV